MSETHTLGDDGTLTREERRSLFLHRAIVRRIAEDPERALAAARRTLARMTASNPVRSEFLDAWRELLDRPLAEILAVLDDPSPRARELRHVTPFAGLLSARERSRVYRAFADAERARDA
jgi:hypothetical protein